MKTFLCIIATIILSLVNIGCRKETEKQNPELARAANSQAQAINTNVVKPEDPKHEQAKPAVTEARSTKPEEKKDEPLPEEKSKLEAEPAPKPEPKPEPKPVQKFRGEQIIEILPLGEVDYEIVEEFSGQMLSESGVISYMRSRNAVIVRDYKENIGELRAFIKAADRPAVNIRIDVGFDKSKSTTHSGLDVDMKYGKKKSVGIIIKDGKIQKPDKIIINPSMQHENVLRNTLQFIVAKSGHPASLWVGKTIVDPTWLNNYRLVPTTVVMGRRGTVIIPGSTPDFVWRDVGASLKMLPRYMDNGLIEVEVYPELSYLDGEGKNQTVKVENISTKLTLRNGQRLDMGGVINSNRDFYLNLFGPDFLSYDDSSSVLNMHITARVMQP